MGTIKTMKAIELIFDWNLWPRYEAEDLDSTNIRRMKEAILAGVELPPVIVDRKSLRLVDGFHRTKAHLKLYGDDADIKVELRDYKNDGEMFLESARLNASHGLPLSPQDRAHVIVKAKKFKIPYPAIAQAIGMDNDKMKEFLEKRTAKTRDGRTIPLAGGAMSLAGKTVTKKQEELIEGINGIKAASNAKILLNELESGAFVITEKLIQNLKQLNSVIKRILTEVGV